MAMEIIPGLPDDIGKLCLLRVSFISHRNMALVCKRWQNFIRSPLFYQERKRFGLSQKLSLVEVWKVTVIKSLYRRPLQSLARYPRQFPNVSGFGSYYIPFQHKLFVVKFTNPNALIIYDFSCGRWKLGPNLPDCRENFCCSVDSVKGLIYIAGGRSSDVNGLSTAAVYHIEEEKWEYLPRMISSGCNCHSVFTDGKFYVATTRRKEGRISAYDPTTRQWSSICACFIDKEPTFAAFERTYYDLFRTSVRWDLSKMLLDSIYWSVPCWQNSIQMEL